MQIEDEIPSIRVISGGRERPWCSVMALVQHEQGIVFDEALHRQWIDKLVRQRGYLDFTCSKMSKSIVIDISIDPNLPAHHVSGFQYLLKSGLRKMFKLESKIDKLSQGPQAGKRSQ